VRAELGKRYRYTLVHGRHSTPVEVIIRLLLCKHLYGWSYEETRERVADSLVLRWFCRVYFQTVPDKSTLIRWTHTLRPETLHALNFSRPGSQVIAQYNTSSSGWARRVRSHPQKKLPTSFFCSLVLATSVIRS
jgi:hypothetical protein